MSKAGLLLVGALVVLMWVGTVIFLWPVLQTNFRGLPPTQARYTSIAGVLVNYLVFAITLIAAYRFVIRRREPEPAVLPEPMPEPKLVPVAAPNGLTVQVAQPLPEPLPVMPAPTASLTPVGQPLARRAVVAAGAGALMAIPTYRLVKDLYDRAVFPYDGTVYSGPGVQPLTPNEKFYTVTKNVVDPNVKKSVWGLEINGHVEHGRTYDFSELTALPATEQETTLMCISNAVGAGLSSNAVWTGVPMRDLLNAAGVQPDAVEVKLYGADGYTDTFAIEKALDPATMVVYLKNGERLGERHGYPARVIVPGLYGEKNVKWVTGIEVIDHDGKGFYETQGWGPNFVIPTRSDIFSPRRTRHNGKDSFDKPISLNQTTLIKGRAFGGDRGVSKVEISFDNGQSWTDATIVSPGTRLTWVFWSFPWRPVKAGDYQLVCRATDGNGGQQTTEVRGIVPQGATGYHKVKATVQ